MKRTAWLDYIKFIAMFMVVLYHAPSRYDTAHEVALFNMGAPVFFFAAGHKNRPSFPGEFPGDAKAGVPGGAGDEYAFHFLPFFFLDDFG